MVECVCGPTVTNLTLTPMQIGCGLYICMRRCISFQAHAFRMQNCHLVVSELCCSEI